MTDTPSGSIPETPGQSLRIAFHRDLENLEADLVSLSSVAGRNLTASLDALVAEDLEACERVAGADAEVNAGWMSLHSRIVRIVATQAPVASELRLLIGMLQSGLHVERVGDTATGVAMLSGDAARAEVGKAGAVIREELHDMGRQAVRMLDAAVAAFAARDDMAARAVARMDDDVNVAHTRLFDQVAALGDDARRRVWGQWMLQIARRLERAGDHAVDIAEEAVFVITGELPELN